jgi:hypothetical protein
MTIGKPTLSHNIWVGCQRTTKRVGNRWHPGPTPWFFKTIFTTDFALSKSTISELDGAVTKVSFSPPKFKPQRWTAHALLCLRMDSVVSDSIAYDLVPLSVPNVAPSLGGSRCPLRITHCSLLVAGCWVAVDVGVGVGVVVVVVVVVVAAVVVVMVVAVFVVVIMVVVTWLIVMLLPDVSCLQIAL